MTNPTPVEEEGPKTEISALEDGNYTMEITFEGGSGKATILSPVKIKAEGGAVTATVQWDSPNYDYMIVDGEKYLPTNEEGMNSVFEIPVLSMDEGMLDPGGTFGTLLLMGVMMLAIASILMAIGLQGKTVFFDNSRQNMEMDNVVMLERDHPIIQEFTVSGNKISDIKIRVLTEPDDDLYSL